MSKKNSSRSTPKKNTDQINQERFVTEKFEQAVNNFSDLSDTELIGNGNFGIVVSAPDNTDSLTKLVFKGYNQPTDKYARLSFERETLIYRSFRDNPIKDIVTPVLIGEAEEIENGDFVGRFTMTRVPGKCFALKWGEEADNEFLEQRAKFYENAGRALAQFHMNAKPENFPPPDPDKGYDGAQVHTVSILKEETNQALKKVDEFLQRNLISGVIHGDFHNGNILVDENLDITGLIDFGMCAYSPNIMIDFAAVPADELENFISSYEKERGIDIPRDMVTVSHLSFNTEYLKYLQENDKDNATEITGAITNINKHLNDLIHITNFKP